MLLGNWVNSAEHVPVDELGAWWSGDGSLVHPSVVAINHLHQISICDHIYEGFIITLFIDGSTIWQISVYCGLKIIPFQRVEESVNNFLLSPGKIRGVALNGKHNTNSGITNFIYSFFSLMNGMHFEILSDSINSVL